MKSETLQHIRAGEAFTRCPLLVIDDNADNLKLLVRLLEWAGYSNVTTTTSAKDGLERINRNCPDLIILDLRMPDMDGFEFLRRIRELNAGNGFLPILVFTGDPTPETKSLALELGASDFLTKPGDAKEIQLRVRNFLRMRRLHMELYSQNEELEARVRERTENLVFAQKEAIEVLALASELRDENPGRHTERVGYLSGAIAARMGLGADYVECLQLAARLHDVGKIAVSDLILHKNEPLTDDETDTLEAHTKVGAGILANRRSPLLVLAQEIALNHHERWDGSGYPAGTKDHAIPLSARIVAVADAYDAITNDRPNQEARDSDSAWAELNSLGGVQFDPAVLEALEKHLFGDEAEAAEAA